VGESDWQAMGKKGSAKHKRVLIQTLYSRCSTTRRVHIVHLAYLTVNSLLDSCYSVVIPTLSTGVAAGEMCTLVQAF